MNKRTSRGFTLIEVLISALTICVFSASLVYMMKAGVKMTGASRSMTRDLLMTKSVMEELRGKQFSELPAYNGSTYDNGRGLITIAPSGNDLLVISAKEKVELVTIRSRYK